MQTLSNRSSTAECLHLIARLRGEQASTASWESRPPFEWWVGGGNVDDRGGGWVGGKYSNIRIQFLPPNTTAKLQPLDQGIIKSTKHNYRTILMTRYLAGVE